METNQKTVTGAMQVLNSRLNLLSPSHLDHVEGRLAALLQKMNNVADKKAVLDDAEKQSKISELYEVCMKAEANAVVLPNIVDRLESLQTLHDQGMYKPQCAAIEGHCYKMIFFLVVASQFSKALTQLDTVQQRLDSSLGSNQSLLAETQTKFSENLSNIQKNFENIEERLNALK